MAESEKLGWQVDDWIDGVRPANGVRDHTHGVIREGRVADARRAQRKALYRKAGSGTREIDCCESSERRTKRMACEKHASATGAAGLGLRDGIRDTSSKVQPSLSESAVHCCAGLIRPHGVLSDRQIQENVLKIGCSSKGDVDGGVKITNISKGAAQKRSEDGTNGQLTSSRLRQCLMGPLRSENVK